jgi:hypothetical protein
VAFAQAAPTGRRAGPRREFFGVQGLFTVPTWPFRALIMLGGGAGALEAAPGSPCTGSAAVARTGGRRTESPSTSRVSISARLPFTRTSPLRTMR